MTSGLTVIGRPSLAGWRTAGGFPARQDHYWETGDAATAAPYPARVKLDEFLGTRLEAASLVRAASSSRCGRGQPVMTARSSVTVMGVVVVVVSGGMVP